MTMREILFRGKREDNGEWVYGDLIHGKGEQKGHLFIWYETDTFPFVKEAEIDPETVGQYTGIPDKKGTKIFDGDIVEHFFKSLIPSDGTRVDRCVVKWDCEECFFFMTSSRNGKDKTISAKSVYEVIGNIHDNPELLEGD